MKRYLLILSLFLLLPLKVSAADPTAVLSVSPASGSQTVGNTFAVDFKLNTGGQEASGVKVDVSYSSNLEYVSYSQDGSEFNLEFIAPNPANNHFSFERLDTNDGGFTGSNGQVLRVTFRATTSGTGTVTINQAASKVVASSDLSNILQSVQNGSYTLNGSSTPTPAPTATPNPVGGDTNLAPTPTQSTSTTTTPTATPQPTTTPKTTSTSKPTPKPSAATTVASPTPAPSAAPETSTPAPEVSTSIQPESAPTSTATSEDSGQGFIKNIGFGILILSLLLTVFAIFKLKQR